MDTLRGDSLINTLSGLGDPDRDKSRGWTVGELRPLNFRQLESLYANGETLAGRVVDLPVDESTKRPFHVYLGGTDDSADEAEPFADALDELQVLEKIAEADRWACLFGGAAIVLDVDDGMQPSEPLDVRRVRELRALRVVDRQELWRASYYQPGETTLDRVGTAKTYHLTPHANGGASNILQADGTPFSHGVTAIHESRVLPFYGFPVPPSRVDERDGWGQPVLERYIAKLLSVTTAEKGIEHILHEWRIAILAVKGLRTIVQSKDGSAQLAERMTAFNLAKSITGLGVIDADGEEFTQQGAPVTGLADLYDRTCQALSAQTGIPVTLLYGQAPKGLTTDNEGGRISWYDQIESRQRKRYRRPVRRICEILRASGQVDVPLDAKFRVEFEPLSSPSEKEAAETRKLQAETDEKYFDIGVLSPDEIRQSRFGGPGYSSDTRLSDELPPSRPGEDDGDSEPPA